ncbi:MAG: T9SS type A sorting domain-containing protein, partial [Bacteroidota bacterium]
VLMTIADGACDFGVSAGNPITFIKGVLQVKLGASVGQTMNSCFYATGSTLRFANTVDYQIPANDKTWASGAINSGLPGIPYNVEILDNGTDLTLNSARALKNNLTITNGTFTINIGAGSEFSLGGNWSRSGVSSAFNNNAGARVVFRGTSPQTITSTATGNTETFREFEISNSGGVGNNTLTLAGSTRLLVTDSIIFTQGIITTGTNRVETNASTVYVAGTGNTNYTQSWINGNLRRNINASNTTIEFPVGLATRGNLAVLTNNNLTGISFFDADFHPVAGGNNAELSAWETSIPGNPFHTQYTSMNSGGFWSIEPNAQPTSGTYDLRLYFNGMLGGMVDNQFGILKRNNGSATYADFKPFPGTSINASNGTGRTIAGGFALRMGYTSFSEFGIGLSGVPLPVQLTTFSGYNEGSVNKLNWNTSSELNSMEFQIERSADGINFQQIGTEAAAGFSTQPLNYNFTDVSPLNGVNYYRLKMVDMDYTYTYSNIIAINPIGMNLGNDIILFPNPSTDNVFANITTVDRREINIVVIDISGRLIMTNRVQLSEGNHIIPIGTSALAGGNYIIEFRDQQNNLINSKKFIKKN